MRMFRSICLGILFLIVNLFASQFKDYQYLYPVPNSSFVDPNATILVRLDGHDVKSLGDVNDFINVTGTESGVVEGDAKIASDGKTIIFKPNDAFQMAEKVTVKLNWNQALIARETISFDFTIIEAPAPAAFITNDEKESPPSASLKKTNASARIMPNGVSVPGDFPHVYVTMNQTNSDEYIWLNNWNDAAPFNVIFDRSGSPVFYMRTNNGDRRRDFKLQKNNTISMLDRSSGTFIGYDNNFNEIKHYQPVDGFYTDEHELQVLENGNYLLIGRRNLTVNMRQFVSGGVTNANVRETAIQEFTANDEKIFEWRALDYMDPADMIDFCDPGEASPYSSNIRFPHMNAIDIDYDGHILLSSRHLSEITKINRNTGEIIWRLGGANNYFDFINDDLDGPRMQHSIRSLGNNHYTIFDNGNIHSPSRSRGVEYVLDTENWTATLVWEYRNPPGSDYSYYMGNTQRISNGNTHINWAVGGRPKASEVTPEGEVVFEMNFQQGYHCYRSFRMPWTGTVDKPNIFVDSQSDGIQLGFNKFGDPDVAYYKIYGGTSTNPTTVIDTSKFTIKKLTNLENKRLYYFRVSAVDSDGNESQKSDLVSAAVNYIEPGINMIVNGDFSNKDNGWTWELRGGAVAELDLTDEECHFDIDNGGGAIYDVQLRQNGMPLLQGSDYVFEFDAWADAPRSIEAKVSQDGSPWINYSQIGETWITTRKRTYSYPFKMNDFTDMNGRVVINTGTTDVDVYIDNIVLKRVDTSIVEQPDVFRPNKFVMYNNYPNPFNALTTVEYYLPNSSEVTYSVYNILGEKIYSSDTSVEYTGFHKFIFDANEYPTGVYYILLQVQGLENRKITRDTKKILLVK